MDDDETLLNELRSLADTPESQEPEVGTSQLAKDVDPLIAEATTRHRVDQSRKQIEAVVGSGGSTFLADAGNMLGGVRAKLRSTLGLPDQEDSNPLTSMGMPPLAEWMLGKTAEKAVDGDLGETTKAAVRGFTSTKEMLGTGIEQYGKTLNLEGLADYGSTMSAEGKAIRENQYLKPAVETFRAIRKEAWVGDTAKYLESKLGEGVGNMAAVAAFYAIAGRAGSFGFLATISIGEMRNDLKEAGITDESTLATYSYAAGLVVAALESVFPAHMLKELSRPAKQAIAKHIASMVVRGSWGGTWREGITEGLQEAVGIAAVAHAKDATEILDADPVIAAFQRGENVDRIVEAMIGGAVPGGAFGAHTSAIHLGAKKDDEKEGKAAQKANGQSKPTTDATTATTPDSAAVKPRMPGMVDRPSRPIPPGVEDAIREVDPELADRIAGRPAAEKQSPRGVDGLTRDERRERDRGPQAPRVEAAEPDAEAGSNFDRFLSAYEKTLRQQVEANPQVYRYYGVERVPEIAKKMVEDLARGVGDYRGASVQAVAKSLGIKPTSAGIAAALNDQPEPAPRPKKSESEKAQVAFEKATKTRDAAWKSFQAGRISSPEWVAASRAWADAKKALDTAQQPTPQAPERTDTGPQAGTQDRGKPSPDLAPQRQQPQSAPMQDEQNDPAYAAGNVDRERAREWRANAAAFRSAGDEAKATAYEQRAAVYEQRAKSAVMEERRRTRKAGADPAQRGTQSSEPSGPQAGPELVQGQQYGPAQQALIDELDRAINGDIPGDSADAKMIRDLIPPPGSDHRAWRKADIASDRSRLGPIREAMGNAVAEAATSRSQAKPQQPVAKPAVSDGIEQQLPQITKEIDDFYREHGWNFDLDTEAVRDVASRILKGDSVEDALAGHEQERGQKGAAPARDFKSDIADALGEPAGKGSPTSEGSRPAPTRLPSGYYDRPLTSRKNSALVEYFTDLRNGRNHGGAVDDEGFVGVGSRVRDSAGRLIAEDDGTTVTVWETVDGKVVSRQLHDLPKGNKSAPTPVQTAVVKPNAQRVTAQLATKNETVKTAWGAELTARAGQDYVVEASPDDRWVVRKDIFDSKYVKGADGKFAQKPGLQVQYRIADRDETIQSLEGPVPARKGDYVMIGTVGEQWAVTPEAFTKRYDATAAPAGRQSPPPTPTPTQSQSASQQPASGRESASPKHDRTPELQAKFRDVLAGTSPRQRWATDLGATPDEMDSLVQWGLSEGLLRERGNGVARTGKTKQAPAPAAQPASPAPSISINPDSRIQGRIANIERATGKKLTEAAKDYASLLEQAGTDPEAQAEALGQIRTDKAVTKPILSEIVAAYTGEKPKAKDTKEQLFKRIADFTAGRAQVSAPAPQEQQPQRKTVVIGTVERVDFPELGLSGVEAKVDTGAATSALHATDITPVGDKRVRFKTQDRAGRVTEHEADVVDRRAIKSSNGKSETRYVIQTPVRIGNVDTKIQVTLTDRGSMQYRMLIGREAMIGMLVDPNAGIVGGITIKEHVPANMLMAISGINGEATVPDGFTLRLPFADKWGNPRENEADREKALARIAEIQAMPIKTASWADLVQAKRDLGEILSQSVYLAPDVTPDDAAKIGRQEIETYAWAKASADRGHVTKDYAVHTLLSSPDVLEDVAQIADPIRRAVDRLLSSKRRGLSTMLEMNDDTEPTSAKPKTVRDPSKVGETLPSGFYFQSARLIGQIPDAVFRQGGQAVLNALNQAGVKRSEIEHFGLQEKFGDTRTRYKVPVTREDFQKAISDRMFDFRRKMMRWNPERPTGDYNHGGTRVSDGPRIPGRGEYFERLLAFPKKLRGGATFPPGFFTSPHWSNEMENAWASLRGSVREVEGYGKMVVGEENQTDYMQGASTGRRPRISQAEFMTLKQERPKFLEAIQQSARHANEIIRALDSGEFASEMAPVVALNQFDSKEMARPLWDQKIAATKALIAEYASRPHAKPESVKKAQDELAALDELRTKNEQYFEPGAKAKFGKTESAYTPETPIDETYVRTMVRDLIITAIREGADSIGIATSETTNRIQANSYSSAAHFYDGQLKPSLEKELRRLSGDGSLTLEQVKLPKALGAPRNEKPYTVWAVKLPEKVTADVSSKEPGTGGLPLFAISGINGGVVARSTRLYRGEPVAANDAVEPERAGQYWTRSLERARGFAGPNGKIYSIDVPLNRMGELRRFGINYVVPEDIRAARQPVEPSENQIVSPSDAALAATADANDTTPADLKGNILYAISAINGDVATGQSMRRDLDALGFYSQALEAAKGLKQAKGTPEQMLAQLKSAGVKQAEIDATNLQSLFDGKKSVTRDEIVKHLEGKRVALNEVQYNSSDRERIARRLESMSNSPRLLINYVIDSVRGYIPSINRSDLRAMAAEAREGTDPEDLRTNLYGLSADAVFGEEAIESIFAKHRSPKWSNYSLDPSNPTYRETVLHLPATSSKDDRAMAMWGKPYSQLDAVRREAVDNEMAGATTVGASPNPDFHSGHFPEPNIVGHMMTSMVKHEGRSVFNLDQVQLDWYDAYIEQVRAALSKEMFGKSFKELTEDQKGKISDEVGARRVRGETLPGVKDEAKIAELNAKITALGVPEYAASHILQAHGDIAAATAEIDRILQYRIGKPERGGFDSTAKLEQARRDLETVREDTGKELVRLVAELRTVESSLPEPHPLARTLDQALNTTLRRAIRQAVEAFKGNKPDANGVIGYIGVPDGRTVLDYNPGDEAGMEGFYGSQKQTGIVPKNLRNLLSKIDKNSPAPVKADQLETPSGMKGSGFTTFPITDAVRQSVLTEGQALFRIAAIGEMSRLSTFGEFSPGFDARKGEIAAAVEAEISKMLPAAVAVRIADSFYHGDTHVRGAFWDTEEVSKFRSKGNYGSPVMRDFIDSAPDAALALVFVGIEKDESLMRKSGYHEVVHALRDLKLWTEKEWALLLERADKLGIDEQITAPHLMTGDTVQSLPYYAKMYGQMAAARKLRGAEAKAFVNEHLNQERVAKLAEMWESGSRFGAAIDALLERIANVLNAIRDALNSLGFNSLADAIEMRQDDAAVNQAFRRMRSGEVAARYQAEYTQAAKARDESFVRDGRLASVEGQEVLGAHGVSYAFAGVARGAFLPGEVWGPKFQKLMSQQYNVAVAGSDLSTQLDILSAKYFNAPNDPPEMRAAMGREILRLREEPGPEWMAKYAPDAQPITGDEPKQITGGGVSFAISAINTPTTRPFSIPGHNGSVAERAKPDGSRVKTYRLNTDSGAPAATMVVTEHTDGRWEVTGVKAEPAVRGTGLASQLYDTVEADLGVPLAPSGWLTEAGYKFWKKRDASKVEHHQNGGELFDGMWLSPKQIDFTIAILNHVAEQSEDPAEIQRAMEKHQRLVEMRNAVPDDVLHDEMLNAMFAIRAFHGRSIDDVEADIGKLYDKHGNDEKAVLSDPEYPALNDELIALTTPRATVPAKTVGSPEMQALVERYRAGGDKALLAEIARRYPTLDDTLKSPEFGNLKWNGKPLQDEIAALVRQRSRSTDSSIEDAMLFAFAGINARTADLDSLTVAKDMEVNGAKREEIWQSTGWFKGVDGKWRFEIDDSLSRYSANGLNSKVLAGRLDHFDLYESYPDMGEMPARSTSGRGGWYADMGPSSPYGQVAIGRDQSAGESRLTALHEVQHGIQDREGFASGEDYRMVGDDYYRRVAGEVEARAVEKRADMLWTDRVGRAPWLDYDVPEDQQIVRFGGGGQQMSVGSGERIDLDAKIKNMEEVQDRIYTMKKDERVQLTDTLDVIKSPSVGNVTYFVVKKGAKLADRKGNIHSIARFSVKPAQRLDVRGVEVTNAYVYEEYQRQGIGTAVYDMVESDWADLGGLSPSPRDQLSPNAQGFWGNRLPPGTSFALRSVGGGSGVRSIMDIIADLKESLGMTATQGLKGLTVSQPGSPETTQSWPPPVAPGFVRMYHGGMVAPDTGGGRWVSPNETYARNYRQGSTLYYVDLPEDSPYLIQTTDVSGTNMKPTYAHVELPEDIAKTMQPHDVTRTIPGTKAKVVGRFKPQSNVRGQYDRTAGKAQYRLATDIEVIAHEGGHHVERLLSSLPVDLDIDINAAPAPNTAIQNPFERLKEKHRTELEALASPGDPDALSEGFSRWFTDYILDRPKAQQMAPKFLEGFESLLDAAAPELLENLDRLQMTTVSEDYQKYLAASDLDRMVANLATNGEETFGDKIRGTANEIATHGVGAWLRQHIGQDGTISGYAHSVYERYTNKHHPMTMIVKQLLETADWNKVHDGSGRAISLAVHENPRMLIAMVGDGLKTGLRFLQDGMPQYHHADAGFVVESEGKFIGLYPTKGEADRVAAGLGKKAKITTRWGSRSPSIHDALSKALGTDWSDIRYRMFNGYLESRMAKEEWAQYEAKQLQMADLVNKITGMESARPRLADQARKLSDQLARREDAYLRNATLLSDRRRAVQKAETELRSIQDRLANHQTGLDEAMKAIDDGSDEARSTRDRKRGLMSRTERDQQAALRRLEAVQQEFEQFDVQGTATDAEVQQLRDMTEKAQNAVGGIDTYMRELRAELKHVHETGLTRPPHRESRATHENRVAKLEAANPTFAEAAEMVYEFLWQRVLHDHQAGRYSIDQVNEFAKKKHYYVPAMRDVSDALTATSPAAASGIKRFAETKRKHGSDRNLILPLESIVDQTFHGAAATHWNDVVLSLRDLALASGPGAQALVEVVDDKELIDANKENFERLKNELMSLGYNETDAQELVHRIEYDFTDPQMMLQRTVSGKGGPNEPVTLSYMENGERKLLRIHDPEFARYVTETLNGVGTEMAQVWFKVMKSFASGVRWGVTTHPAFIIPNLARDSQVAFGVSGSLLKPSTYPIVTQLRGLMHEIKQTDLAKMYQEVGGIAGGMNVAELSDVAMNRDVLELKHRGIKINLKTAMALGATGGALGFFAGSVLTAPARLVGMNGLASYGSYALGTTGMLAGLALNKGPLHFKEQFAMFADMSEVMTRLGVAAYSYIDATEKNPNLTPFQAMQHAASVSRRLINFGQHGSQMVNYNKLVQFLNAWQQGVVPLMQKSLGHTDRGLTFSPIKMGGVAAAAVGVGFAAGGPIGGAAGMMVGPTLAAELARRHIAVRNLMMPFWKRQNGLELSKDEERALADSVKFWVNISFIALLGSLLYAYGDDDDDIKAVNQRTKRKYHIWHAFGELVGLPKAFELGFPTNIMEAAIDAQIHNDPNFWERAKESFADSFAPGQVLPQLGVLYRDVSANYNSLSGGPIVPDYLLKLPPEQRVNAYSSNIAVWLSDAINKNGMVKGAVEGVGGTVFGPKFEVSPLLIDYVIGTQGAYWGKDAQKASNVMTSNTDSLTEAPIIGTIASRVRIDPYRASQALMDLREIEAGKKGMFAHGRLGLVQAANGYKREIDEALKRGEKPDAAIAFLVGLTDEERDYALVENRRSTYEKMKHPINRATAIRSVVSDLQRDIVMGRMHDSSLRSEPEPIPLAPNTATELLGLFQKLLHYEMHNSLVAYDYEKYKGDRIVDVEPIKNAIKASNEKVYNQYELRLGRYKHSIVDHSPTRPPDINDIKRDWPELKKDMREEWERVQKEGGLPSGRTHKAK